MKRGYLCEGCKGFHSFSSSIWLCAGCRKEICESCFDRYAHCGACAVGHTDRELALAANENLGWSFDIPE